MSDLSEFYGSEGFDPSSVSDSDLLPKGTYRAVVSGTQTKTSNAGNKYMSVELQIIHPAEFANRKIWDTLNLAHEKPTVRQGAERRLKAYCGAVGVGRLESTSQLFNKALLIDVVVEGEGESQRSQIKKVHKYLATGNNTPTTAAVNTSPNADPF